MRIAINCRSILKPQRTGIGRYTHHLIKALARADHANDYVLYAPRGIFNFKRVNPSSPAPNFKVRRDCFSLGPEKVCGPVDVYHLPSPDFLGALRCKVVVTVHDLIDKAYPQSHTPQTIDLSDRKMKDVVGRADKIICCSQTTRDDLHRFFKVDAARTCVIYQGVDRTVFFPLAPDEEEYAEGVLKGLGVTQPFILFVGTIEPRKNLSNLLEAFAGLKAKKKFSGKLVIVGTKGWMMDPLADTLNHKGLSNEVVFLGYVTDEQLRVLYHKTEVFVFPSLYEGFGFPIVEAFACGAAVVASNTSSCAEVAGDSALTVAPQPQDIAAGILRVIEDPSLKASLKAKGLQRADQFSFDATARRTLDVYQEVNHVR
ncbi:MAG: glycosyltransferase family 1 protein [Candidatus Omnitrophota bacterium]|nr:glycosyltransferase family 1 protein [Candidatus Omnitrophota bacterium]